MTGEFHDVIWLVLFFNVGDVIIEGRKGASEDGDCVNLGVSQLAGVKVGGCHIGLAFLIPIEVGTRCDAGMV